ncbi:efflux RND transporter permease subunit [Rhodophyticola sp. CCM32]|uniref:efflux RND transporter permease subunit n=1 Tax=Rhodophyticola sp. CCM32 TaxID=2916397 RepID=UPI00107F186F|nr:efflux RND transporter permease subunit [Rhodophyticola sp. CCM32]QBY01174.1 efflux RND transporter permease subunit [Rhodophyticola sp. CCM32]
MNMSVWAIRQPVPSLALFLVLMVLGMVGFARLPVTQFPNIDIPIITVNVGQAGAAPSEITNQIIRPIEDAVSDVSGVRHVQATATDSVANITIEFELETNTDRALNDIKDAVTSVEGELPEAATEPVIQRLDVTGQPILTYAVSNPTISIEALSYFVDDVVARDLQSVDGVGQVTRIGGAEREIRVDLAPDRLLALGLSASGVNDQLRQSNINLGGGRGDLAGQEYSIRTLGSAETLHQLAATPITLPSGPTIRLDQIATVTDGAAEVRNFAMLDGQPVVAFGVFRSTGASDLLAGDGVKHRLEEMAADYPDVTFSLIDDATIYTEGNYHSAMETLYEGAALAIIVVMLFLWNWRATVITAIALPLSIIPTFIVMYALDFSLNTVSLLGITLVTGILVDDAIVEIENIVRHIRMGRPAYEATEEAASEIGLTVIAISFTIVAVFAPVSFMSGIAGQYFRQFGLTVAVAVLFSLLVARLITPMIAAHFLRDGVAPEEEERDGVLMRTYMRILRWTLHNRAATLALGFVIFAASIFSATLLPTEFIPAADTGRSNISVELPPGATLEETRVVSRGTTGLLADIPEVENIFVHGGEGSINTARMMVNLGSKSDRDRSLFEIEDEISERLLGVPDVRLHVLNDNGERDIQISVLGDSEAAANAAAITLAAQINDLDMVENASSTAALTRPEIQITPRPELAAERGVTAVALANTIRIATIGDTDENTARFNAEERQIPIVVRIAEDVRRDLFLMQGQRVPSANGSDVPLGVIADVALSTGPAMIDRYDRQYRTLVEADLAPGALLGPANAASLSVPVALDMPEGTSIQSAGDAEIMGDVFTSFGLAMGAGILLVYVVLVLLFSSFLTPVTILLSLPLAIGGAIFALYILDYAIGLSVVIGFLMLMGIVTKNAIMLVEFALQGMAEGMDKNSAMIEAGHKRARPIIMTTIAMTAGMVPSALALGEGGEFRSPMAVAVIGGLLLSTLLSLLFVPSMFSLINGLRVRLRRGLVSVLGANQPKPAE